MITIILVPETVTHVKSVWSTQLFLGCSIDKMAIINHHQCFHRATFTSFFLKSIYSLMVMLAQQHIWRQDGWVLLVLYSKWRDNSILPGSQCHLFLYYDYQIIFFYQRKTTVQTVCDYQSDQNYKLALFLAVLLPLQLVTRFIRYLKCIIAMENIHLHSIVDRNVALL